MNSKDMVDDWLKKNEAKQLSSSAKNTNMDKEFHIFKGVYKGTYKDSDGEWCIFSNVTSSTTKKKFSKNQSFKTKQKLIKNTKYEFKAYFSNSKHKEKRRLLKGVKTFVEI